MHWEAKFTLCSFQHIWTPDVIIHDLVKFNKPEILNQVWNGNFYTICQLPGWCPGNFQWQASLLQSEVVSNYFFQSWNINHQREFAKNLLGATSPWFAKQWSLASTRWIITNAISSWQAVSVDSCSSIVKWFNISKHQIIPVSSLTLYILSDLLCKCFCRVITLQCFSLQDKIHPPTLNTYDIFFSVQSNQVCHKLANQKTPNIWILSIFNYHIYFRSKLVIFLSFFQLDMTRSIWSLRANGCIGWKWYSMIFWL